jgi:hypothetical protein
MAKKQAHRATGLSPVLRRHPLYLIFFGFVTAHKECGHTWAESAERFMQRFGLTEEDVTAEALIREGQRMVVDSINHPI